MYLISTLIVSHLPFPPHTHHLAEDEHPVAGLLEPSEQLVEEHHLAAGQDQAVNNTARGRGDDLRAGRSRHFAVHALPDSHFQRSFSVHMYRGTI